MTDDNEPVVFESADGTIRIDIGSGKAYIGAITASTIDTNIIAHRAPLFVSWLDETLKLQKEFYKDISGLPQNELEDWMRVNALAAEDEIHEALNEISWKPWAKSEFFNREAFIGECVDVLHFIGNMLAAAGCSDAELNAAYLEKMERNRERQRTGYTGLDKCDKCGRAADDVVAHGGTMTQRTELDVPIGYGCDDCYGDSK